MRLIPVILLVLLSRLVIAQADSTRRADTTVVEDRFSILPGMPVQSARHSAHAQVRIPLKENSTFGLGISVYNAARGRVPGMQIDPYYQVDTLTWRTSSPLVVVDGVVFNQSMRSFYNLNAFEYDDTRMILGNNGSLAYGGGGGTRGAIVLHSRSGEGYAMPTFDFNTYTTYAWNNDYFLTSQWNLSNSFGYSQDFGNLDLRVSTNYTAEPPGDAGTKGPAFWGLKANVGYSLNRFTARLILQRNTRWISQTGSTSFQSNNDLLQGNLMLAYSFNNWLSMSGQVSQSQLTDHEQRDMNTYASALTINDRLTSGNVLIHANKKVSNSISLSASAGWTVNSTHSNTTGNLSSAVTNPPDIRTLSRSYEVTTQSILATADIGYKEKLFVGSTFRRDFVDYYKQSDAYNAYSIYASYAFHGMIDPSAKVLSFAKVRTSYGRNDNRLDTSVPRVGSLNPFPGARRTSGVEAGLELGFLKGRIQFMGNYFLNTAYSNSSTAIIDPATGYSATYFGYGNHDVIVDGFEFLARMNVVQRKSFSYATQLIAGWNTTTVETTSAPQIVFPNVPSQPSNPSNLPSSPSPYPDWTGGWLNQVTLGRLSFSMLIDVSMGGYIYSPSPRYVSAASLTSSSTAQLPDSLSITRAHLFNGNYTIPMVDRSFVKIRDISVGYQFPFFSRMKGFVALSFRNLVTLYSHSDTELEAANSLPALSKSASVSFSLQF